MKKALLLCMALVLCLGSLGVGYAMWSDDIDIDGTVTTGNVDVEWSLHGFWDTETKDVSEFDVQLDATNTVMTVEITNAYPCNHYYAIVDVTSLGSVPVHLGIVVDKENMPGSPELELLAAANVDPAHVPTSITLPNVSDPVIEEYTQLHQAESAWAVLHFHFDNDDQFEQGCTAYTFSMTVTGYQYNEWSTL